jgi:hypothetical protein
MKYERPQLHFLTLVTNHAVDYYVQVWSLLRIAHLTTSSLEKWGKLLTMGSECNFELFPCQFMWDNEQLFAFIWCTCSPLLVVIKWNWYQQYSQYGRGSNLSLPKNEYSTPLWFSHIFWLVHASKILRPESENISQIYSIWHRWKVYVNK